MERYRVVHATTYAFARPAGGCALEARLEPRPLPHQVIERHELLVTPPPIRREASLDAFGNPVARLRLEGPLRAVEVTAVTLIGAAPLPPPEPEDSPPWEQARDALRAVAASDPALAACLEPSPRVPQDPALAALARASFSPGRPLLAAVAALCAQIRSSIAWDPGATSAATTAARALALGRGVCQDFAHIAIGALRALGLPARYVGGYRVEPGVPATSGAGAHAWASTPVPGCGWVDFDPGAGGLAAPLLLTLAWGRDHADVSPLRGEAWGRGERRLRVRVEVTRLPQGSSR